MNEEMIKIKLKFIKKPELYAPISLHQINFQNNLKNYINQASKATLHSKKKHKKYNCKTVKGQILSLTQRLNEYTQNSNENIKIINDLKDENDVLIFGLHNNIEKSETFNKKTEDVFHDLIVQYKSKGYKIPNLSKTNNLFKKNPLLIENKNDVNI